MHDTGIILDSMIKEALDRLDTIEEIAEIGSFDINLETRTWTASVGFMRMFKLDVKEYYDLEEFKALIQNEQDLMKFAFCINSDEKQVIECKCLTADHRPAHIECSVKMVRGFDGAPQHILGVARDITAIKIKEKHLEDLAVMNQTKDETLIQVAHDLKSPINQISAILNLIKINPNVDHSEFIGILETACNTAGDIISDLVEAAQMHTPSYELNKSRCDLNKIAEEAISLFSYQAAEKNISFRRHFCDKATANVDAGKISRAIGNLLGNAVKFSHPGGIVEVKTRIIGNNALIVIKDDGVGIPKANIPYIFDRFSNVRQPALSGEKSSGLGLSIVKKIAALHGGSVSVVSAENQGSEFTIELPR